MDTKVVIDCLKCPLCSELFENPKKLPCGHNVCERCLKYHIIRTVPVAGCNINDFLDDNNPDGKPSEQSFKCPVDENKITPENPNQEVSKWVHQFENNLKIVTLIELCKGKVRGFTEECDNCIDVLQKVTAASVCVTCIQKFCVKCAFIHRHTHPKDLMFNLSAVQRVLVENNSPGKGSTSDGSESKEFCKIHLFSKINFFCFDCNSKCCKLCKPTLHSECRHVAKLDDVNEEFQTNGTLPQLDKRFNEVLEQTLTVMKTDLELLEKAEELAQSVKENIQLNEMLSNLRCQVSRWEVLYEHAQTSLKMLNDYKHATGNNKGNDRLDWLAQTEIECQLIEREIEYHKEQESDNSIRIKQYENVIEWQRSNQSRKTHAKDKSTNKSNRNKNSQNKISMNYNLKSLDLFELKNENEMVDITQKVQVVEKLNMKVADDKEACWLTDCLFVNVGFVTVVDRANKCIKWKVRTGQLQKVVLPSSPQCIAANMVLGNTGCVTLPDDKKIQFFCIDDDVISLTRCIVTNESCFGVCYVDDSVAVSCADKLDYSVKILNTDGVELRKISSSNAIPKEKLFSDPRYVSVLQREGEIKLFVAEFRVCKVTCLTLEGVNGPMSAEMITNHTQGYPLGLDTDIDGNVIVCCNNKGIVQMITNGSERQHRLLVRSLWQPRAISVLKRGNMFISTSDSGPDKNYVLVHEFVSKAC